MNTNRGWCLLGLTLVIGIGAAGCQKKEDMSKMFKTPPRPAELDRLDSFAGTWEWTGEMKMAGSDKVTPFKGTGIIAWEADNWALVEKSSMSMGDSADRMSGLAIWSYDLPRRKYRFYGTGAMGTFSGWGTYDDKSQAWKFSGTSEMGGQKTCGKGTMRFVDQNTMEWSQSEYAFLGLIKVMDMKGTGRRK